MKRSFLFLVLPVAVLITVTGILPVLPTDIGRSSQLAQLIDIREGVTTGGTIDIGTTGGSINDFTNTAAGNTLLPEEPTYFQILPNTPSSPTAGDAPAAGSAGAGNTAQTGDSSIGTGSTGGSTIQTGITGGGLSAGGSVFSSQGSAGQLLNQYWQQQQQAIIDAQQIGDFTKPVLTEPSLGIPVGGIVPGGQVTGGVDPSGSQSVSTDLKTGTGALVGTGGTAVLKGADTQSQSLQIWLPEDTSLVKLNDQVVLLPGTSQISLTPCAGCVSMSAVPVRIAPEALIDLSTETAPSGNASDVITVEKAGDLLDAIAVANDILGRQEVPTTGGAITVTKTTGLNLLVQGVGNLVNDIGKSISSFFTSLGGGSITGGSRGCAPPTGGELSPSCSATSCTDDSGASGVCTLATTNVSGYSDGNTFSPDRSAFGKDQTIYATTQQRAECVCQASVPSVPTTGPACPKAAGDVPRTTPVQRKISVDAVILLAFAGGPQTTESPNCIQTNNPEDPQNADFCVAYSGTYTETAAGPVSPPSAWTTPPAPTDHQETPEEKAEREANPIRRDDEQMRAALVQQLQAIGNPSSALAANNPEAAAAVTAAQDGAKKEMEGEVNATPAPPCPAAVQCAVEGIACPQCGPNGVQNSGSLTKGPLTIEIVGFKTGESNTPHQGKPSASQIAAGLYSVDVKITQKIDGTAEQKFLYTCGGSTAFAPFAFGDPGNGGEPEKPGNNGGGGAKGGGDDDDWNLWEWLKRIFGGADEPDPYAPPEEPPVEEPQDNDDVPPLPPPDREDDIPLTSIGPTTNALIPCGQRSKAMIDLLTAREQERQAADPTGYRAQPVSRCGGYCPSGQTCDVRNGVCGCAVTGGVPPVLPNVPASPDDKPAEPNKEPVTTDQKPTPPSAKPDPTPQPKPQKRPTLDNCKLTNGAVGFDVPETGELAGMLVFTDLNGKATAVMSYAAFQKLSASDRARVLGATQTAGGSSISDAAKERAKAVCQQNVCSSQGNSQCVFNTNAQNVAESCSCGSAGKVVTPSPTAPPPAAGPNCEDTAAPQCGGKCSNGTCGAKTYPICGDDHDDYPGLASGWTAQDWADKKKEMEGQCGTIDGKGLGNCKCSVPKPKTPSPTPTPDPTPIPKPNPLPPTVTTTCSYTYHYRVILTTASNCGPCQPYKPAEYGGPGDKTILAGILANLSTSNVTVVHDHVADYGQVTTANGYQINGTPQAYIAMDKIPNSGNGSNCPPGFTNKRSNSFYTLSGYSGIADEVKRMFQANR